MSYRQILYQIVFATKYRKPVITRGRDEELYQYIAGVIRKKKCVPYCINGIEDHIHILSDVHPTICLSDLIKDIKVSSSMWMKETRKFPAFEAWQISYGAFTYSIKEKNVVSNYIQRQKEHHKKEVFIDEFKRLLIENDVEFDERYLL